MAQTDNIYNPNSYNPNDYPHDVYIALGSNIDPKLPHLLQAQKHIAQQIGPPIKYSSIYQSIPWQMDSHALFLNQVLHIKTALSPMTLLKTLLNIEQSMGRTRQTRPYLDRIIDLDILYYDNLHLEQPKLCIPHKDLHKRSFVLLPMIEIAPNWKHPVFNKTQLELLPPGKCFNKKANGNS